jgi:very-short-patch-repair endonuclease
VARGECRETKGWAPVPPSKALRYNTRMRNPLASANRRRMTDAEMRLWFRLRPMRQQKLAFRRQSPIGQYIVDFECRRAKLVVEVDGGQHGTTDGVAYDAARTAWLRTQGYEVLRFWNHDVLRHTDVIVEQIIDAARRRSASA